MFFTLHCLSGAYFDCCTMYMSCGNEAAYSVGARHLTQRVGRVTLVTSAGTFLKLVCQQLQLHHDVICLLVCI